MLETQTLLQKVQQAFRERYQSEPSVVVRAPGRVNLIGEHTDYNDGFVLPMAIDRAVWIALRRREDAQVEAYSLDFDDAREFAMDKLQKQGDGWIEYVQGLAWALQDAGHALNGWEGVIAGDVPVGAGLSSSAALELASARAFAAVSGIEWHATEMAVLSQKAENQWVGINCGIMDQLISAEGKAGHAQFIDCRSLDTRPVPLPEQVRFVVLYSAAPRKLTESAYNQRRSECESAVASLQAVYPDIRALRDVTPEMLSQEGYHLNDVELKRARHIVAENTRVVDSVEAMEQEDMTRLGQLMVSSHLSLRDDYEVSSPELDTLVSLALEIPGVLGARLTGAGFGGCAIALVETAKAEEAATIIITQYRALTSLPGDAYVTFPSNGASVEEG